MVQLSVSDLLHQTFHVGLDHGVDHASHQDLDSEQAEELRFRPAVELRRMGVDETEHNKGDREREQRLEKRDYKVGAVLKLVHGPDPNVEPGDGERTGHQLPTAV